MKVLYLGSNESKNSGKDLNKIEASLLKGREIEKYWFENKTTKMLNC